MLKHTLILLVTISLSLAACQGQNQTAPTTVSPTPAVRSTATQSAKATTSTEEVEQALTEASPGCTVISVQETSSPPQESIFPPVTENDWITGPDDAAITLIEYSDFQ